jgi:hypothetical protein
MAEGFTYADRVPLAEKFAKIIPVVVGEPQAEDRRLEVIDREIERTCERMRELLIAAEELALAEAWENAAVDLMREAPYEERSLLGRDSQRATESRQALETFVDNLRPQHEDDIRRLRHLRRIRGHGTAREQSVAR